jgi:hypothetical protein
MTFARPTRKPQQVPRAGARRPFQADPTAAVKHMSHSRGEPMQRGLAKELGGGLGQIVDGVVLHRDAAAADAAASINAQAFSVNEHIFFGGNSYAPNSAAGRQLIAHETTHVLQHQRGDIRAGAPTSSPGEKLENEADRAAANVDPGRARTGGGADPGGRPPARASSFVSPQAGARMMRLVCPKTKENFGKKGGILRIADIKRCLENMEFEHGKRKRVTNDYTDTIGWTEQDVQSALDEIYKYAKASDKRLFTAWNGTQDDLRHYPNILTYIRRLNQLSKTSMGIESYTDASGAMQQVYFAGNEFKVNPRAVYFVAAAQFAMDLQADSAQGDGHYIPMGAFRFLVKNIYQDLATIVAGAAQTKTKNEKHPIPGSKDAYNAMLTEVKYMCNAILVQKQAGTGTGAHLHGEHRDPTVVAYLEARSSQISPLNPADGDADAQTQAYVLMSILAQSEKPEPPKKFGIADSQHTAPMAVDPHGTDHAMGMAIDLFKGQGSDKDEEGKRWSSGAFTNSGFKDQLVAYQLLIANFGDDTKGYDTKQGFAYIPPTTKLVAFTSLSHEQARSLDRLAMERMDDLMDIIEGNNPHLQSPFELRVESGNIIMLDGKLSKDDKNWIFNKRSKAIRDYSHQQKNAFLSFSARESAFSKLLDRPTSVDAMGKPLGEMVTKEQVELDYAKANATFMDPRTLITTLESRADALDEIVKAAKLRQPAAEDEWAGNDVDRENYLEIKRTWRNYEMQREQKEQEQAEAQTPERKDALKTELKKWKKDADGYGGAETTWDRYRAKHKKIHKSASSIDNTFATLREAGPTMGRNLRQIRDKVDGMYAMALWAHAHMEKDRLENIEKKKSWSQSVGNPERGLYDQSTVMVRAIESVKSYKPKKQKPTNPSPEGQTDVHNLKAGHHWRIGPTWDEELAKKNEVNHDWDLLTNDQDYQDALAQDMEQRKDQLESIMEVMAETPAGQAVIGFEKHQLPGYRSAAEGYERAMIQVLKDKEAFDKMRERVYEKVVEPFSSDTLKDKNEYKLKMRMRMRGHHIV